VIATFEVEVNGRLRTVAVERVGSQAVGRYRVTIDGHTRLVDARPAGPGRLSLLFPEEQSRSFDVAMAPASVTDLDIYLPDGAVRAIVNGRRSRREGPSEASASGDQRILAPMPGRVVRVLVAAGDEVRARQPLVVVEAMKMENELSAPRAGRVKDVQVRDGMSVDAGRLLVVVE
jgi:biotin carboxyl carrier protein